MLLGYKWWSLRVVIQTSRTVSLKYLLPGSLWKKIADTCSRGCECLTIIGPAICKHQERSTVERVMIWRYGMQTWDLWVCTPGDASAESIGQVQDGEWQPQRKRFECGGPQSGFVASKTQLLPGNRETLWGFGIVFSYFEAALGRPRLHVRGSDFEE